MATKVFSDKDMQLIARLLNLPDAIDGREPVTLDQARAMVENLNQKDDVAAGASANINLAAPGSSVGGVTSPATFLARGQTAPEQNGIYNWNGASVPATRRADSDTMVKLKGAIVLVTEGTDAGTQWRQTAVTGTIGTDPVSWTAAFSATPDASETTKGIAEILTQGETDTGTDDARILTIAKLVASPWSAKHYSTLIGDGSTLLYTITHNLGSKRVDAHVQYESDGDRIDVNIKAATDNTLTVTFAAGLAPTSNQFRVNVSL